MKLTNYLKRIASVTYSERSGIIETINMQNYGSNILTETDMWILRTAAENEEYLNDKLEEVNNSIKLDSEAPAETSDIEQEILALDTTAETSSSGALDALDTSTISSNEEPVVSSEEPSTASETAEVVTSIESEEEPEMEEDGKRKIETSLEGVGILPLLAEIQDKLANGKPSEIELAALKAMKKMF